MGSGSSAIEKTKQIGNEYFKAGDYSKASIAYSKAIKHDQFNAPLLSNRSACYLKLGKYKESLEDALACIKQSPGWNKGYYRMASALKACNLLSEALIYAEISLAIAQDQIVVSLISGLKSQVQFVGRSTLLIWGNQNPRPSPVRGLEAVQITEVYEKFRACGVNHSLAVTSNRMVYAWGDNTYAQCGVEGNCSNPRLIVDLLSHPITAVIAGGGHSLAIASNGDVFAWGINAYGQCGFSGTAKIPQQIRIQGKVRGGSAGLGHTALIMEDSYLYMSGWNSQGQLGQGNNLNFYEFTSTSIANANYVSCGAAHTLVVLKNGTVLAAGGNSCGQLGLGYFTDQNKFTLIDGLQDISLCRCGEEFSIAISSRSIVYTFGKS